MSDVKPHVGDTPHITSDVGRLSVLQFRMVVRYAVRIGRLLQYSAQPTERLLFTAWQKNRHDRHRPIRPTGDRIYNTYTIAQSRKWRAICPQPVRCAVASMSPVLVPD